MSRSNPTIKNPATRFMQWRGGETGGGKVTYYNKETETEIDVQLPFTFLVLDELNAISGFNNNEKSSYWSNEVRNITKDTFVVKTKSGTKANGKYADLGDIKSKGAKYAKSVYVAFKDETGELVIGNIRIMGAALTAWIDLQKQFDVSKCAVIITESPVKDKKGATTYFIPVFEVRNISDETESEAVALDRHLQAYLSVYLSSKPEADEIEEYDDDGFDPSVATNAPVAEPVNIGTPKESDDTINIRDVSFQLDG